MKEPPHKNLQFHGLHGIGTAQNSSLYKQIESQFLIICSESIVQGDGS